MDFIKKHRFFALIVLIMLLSFGFGMNTVYAGKMYCADIPINYCPDGAKDSYGNPCKLGYNGSTYGCMKNETAKTCKDYQSTGACPSKDDYGNTCKYYGDPSTCYVAEESSNTEFKTCNEYTDYKTCPVGKTDYKGNLCDTDSSGNCYISVNKQKCTEIKQQSLCENRQGECKWLVNNGYNSCYSVIVPSATSEKCENVTDDLTCILRTDCVYIDNTCTSVIEPTSDSPACSKITNLNECRARVDCDPYYPAFGTERCESITKINNIKHGTTTDDILIEKEEFVCSDVKFLTSAWLFIRILAPFLIVLFGSLDFFKAMIANDEKKMKEARAKFPKRLIAFILLILLPFTIQFIFSVMGTYGSQNVCLVKCIATNDTSEKGCD